MGPQRRSVHFSEKRGFRKCGIVKVIANENNEWKLHLRRNRGREKFSLPFPTNSPKLRIDKTVSLRLVRSLDSSVSIVTRLRVGRWVNRVLFAGRGKRIFSIASRPDERAH